MDAHPDVHGVCGRYQYPDGRFQRFYTQLPTEFDMIVSWGVGRHLHPLLQTMDEMTDILRNLGFSVAADRTPADVSAFVTHVNWRPGWHWLLGNQAELQAVWSTWSFVLNGTDVVHQEIAHVINKQGKVVASYNAPYYPAELAATITAQWVK